MQVVYESLSMVQLTAPYIPGFLAFRESEFLIDKVRILQDSNPELVPQAILVDGNGILHPKGKFELMTSLFLLECYSLRLCRH